MSLDPAGLIASAPDAAPEAGRPDPVRTYMQLALDLADVVIWHHDLSTLRISCSARGHALLGQPPEGHTDWSVPEFLELIHPDDRELARTATARARASDAPVDELLRYRHRDGHWIHASTRRVLQRDAQGQAVALLGVAMDVSDRRQTLAELHQAAERMELVTQAVGIGTWVLELPSRTLHWDRQMWLLRGLDPRPRPLEIEQMLAMTHPDDRPLVRERLRHPDQDRPDNGYEFRLCLPDGTERWLAARSVLLRDTDGRPCQRIGANWDVTDARRSAADRQDRALALRESEAKSEMLARLSHELRTPLNAILGFTRLLIEDDATQGAAQRGRRLQHIESAGQHLLSLINDVLELSRPEQASSPVLMAPVGLGELLAQSLPMVEAQAAARGLQWQIEVPPGLAVLADPVRLKQVLLNLLTNAIKYNRDGGLIHLSAAAIGGRVLLRVRDTGIGMAVDQLREAFEPFQRLRQHPGVEGVGIGLAIVRTLMQRMGGAVRVRSEPGVGSEFELTLAQAEPAAAAIEPESRQASLLPPPENRATLPCVLYIEDNPVNMMIVEELVARRGGLRLVGAVDAASGLAAARDEHPSLILIDMHLPDAHGHEVLARLRQEPATAGIPCVALSANALAADIETALQLGFSDYWTKPLDFRAFHQALDSLFGPAG